MFEAVGRPAQAAPARRVGALLLSLTMNAAFIGLLVAAGAGGAAAVVEVEAAIERPVELAAPTPGPPSGAPAPKLRKAARSLAPPAVPRVEPAPPTLTAVEQADDGTGADEGPAGDGLADGIDGGLGLGGTGEDPAGRPGGGVRVVHWSELVVKVRPQVRAADYPQAARDLGLPGGRCVVRIRIDDRGVPAEVTARTCPEVFRAAAENVAARYRFYPMKVEGAAVAASFDLTLNFEDR